MQLPFFYTEALDVINSHVQLNEETSRHIVQVLRMQIGKQIKLTDGLGYIYVGTIIDAHKKNCLVKVVESTKQPMPNKKVCIAISPLKNSSRLEWFLEKATEIGVSEIVLLQCERTEKQHLRLERLKTILISAMLQSQQAWLPILKEPIKFNVFVKENIYQNKFIAHCEEQSKKSLKEIISQSTNQIKSQSNILIGPEGDFSSKEIAFAKENNFMPVSLGNTRLRTETAALVAATLLCLP